ncbi:MAG: hypothetical protein JNJ43_16715 [Anaerolineales bacterium]|nr:hypothetical protein [Anaerolineales bacterium]
MKTKTKLYSIVLALVLSMFWTVPVFADESTPPAEPTPEVIVTEGDTTTEQTVDEEPLQTQPEVDSASETESISDEETTPAELLEQLPEDVEVVVIDSEGQPMPLVSEEASEVILTKDPIWCPAGVAPKAGVGGCSNSYGSLADLINDIYAGNYIPAGKNSVIWIEQGTDASLFTAIGIDGDHANFVAASAFSLTLKGGWVYNTTGATTINQSNPTELNVPLSIYNWEGAITLSDIEISAQTSNAGSDYALYIETTKNIQLDRVVLEDNENTNGGANYRTGAYLDNTSGTGSVIINNSVFNNNEASGLNVYSKGAITINGIIANSNNLGDGVYLNNILVTGGQPISIKGFKQFNGNNGSGLSIASTGVVTISNIVANGNLNYGVSINNVTSSTKAGVTIGGVNYFNNNGIDGLSILSAGAITASNLNASGNTINGVSLDNCSYDGGNNWCQATVSKPVTVSGTNMFSNNGGEGLSVQSFGAVTLNNITSNYNFEALYVDNSFGNLNAHNNTGGITLKGYGKFTGSDHGPSFNSYGSISLTNLLVALHTQEGGLLVYAEKPGAGVANVTITGTNFVTNTDGGVYIYADGKVSISNLNVTNSEGEAYIEGVLGVTLTGVNNFSNTNQSDGLVITSTGPIVLHNITANGNNNSGVLINNQANPTKPMAVTLHGVNNFNQNVGGYGLQILSYGTITLNNVTAIDNGLNGIEIDNCDYNGSTCDNVNSAPVNLLGYVNVLSSNNDGINITSNGAVTTNNVVSNLNGGEGMVIQNYFNNLKPMNVTLKGTNSFSNNDDTGLMIYSYGAIIASNITANSNNSSGAILDNNLSGTYLTKKAITLTGINSFSNNSYDGLNFASSGAFTSSNIYAIGNDGFANAYSGKGIFGF